MWQCMASMSTQQTLDCLLPGSLSAVYLFMDMISEDLEGPLIAVVVNGQVVMSWQVT